MMLVTLENDDAGTSQHMHVHSPVGVENAGYVRQPILMLRVGAYQDPGIRRKYRPNEDTLFVTQGIMPSASTAPKPFVLLVVADGMGGREHGRKASRLATWSLAGHVYGSLCREQRLPEDLLSLLTIGVQYANQAVYEYNQQQGTTMGTTMTAALVIETTTYVAHVGDSRLYLYREPQDSRRSPAITRLWPNLWQRGSSRPTTSIRIPCAIKSIAAWEVKPTWKWTLLSCSSPRRISCCCAPMGCGKWCATSRLPPL